MSSEEYGNKAIFADLALIAAVNVEPIFATVVAQRYTTGDSICQSVGGIGFSISSNTCCVLHKDSEGAEEIFRMLVRVQIKPNASAVSRLARSIEHHLQSSALVYQETPFIARSMEILFCCSHRRQRPSWRLPLNLDNLDAL